MSYEGIKRAALEIALDNGGINRFRSEKMMSREFERWIVKQPQEMLPAIDAWLSSLSREDLQEFCCGGEGEPERERISATAPPFTDDLLNRYFEEVC
ncbi:hypothetical protein LB523_12325 [Mesorhizobium sp. ESP-6-4]|uniref:hypothetical protein n=1 Tax=Mesorhizobium sp. ESP-6-4 TaxID=2876624 RepID=UPI001CCFE556|nr:hypothetical protein [Mesorhizobium sp. ESP-6-4]MBZ9659833.1 hypothetical protein [Mesorhizobium sp. ESP-6-4]